MAGLTIDQFDIGIYIQYARRTQLIEQVRQQYHLQEAQNVPAQAIILDLYPRLSELDLLLGTAQVHSPWAYFYAPRNFSAQRRSPFAFHRILPVMEKHDNEESEKEQTEEEILASYECTNEKERKEKSILMKCFKKIDEINSLLRYIGGRIGQFLQG